MSKVLFVFCLAVLVIFANFVDVPLSVFVSQNATESLKSVSNIVTFFGGTMFIMLANFLILIYFLKKRDSEKVFYTIMSIATQVYISIFVNIIKRIVGRVRPFYLIENDLTSTFTFFKWNYEYLSFPSGHSQGIWCFIICLFFIFFGKKDKWKFNFSSSVLVLLGVVVPISRVILLRHYLSDVIIGSLIGGFVGYRVFLSVLKNNEDEKSILRQVIKKKVC
ncbi:MAG: phosphatase PAP2 family protein [Rickettsiales bacterium]|jgi:undecaprenyl-diphosphatase|nr:phosphatase PAP2 family protein [Rickettsiales bacterium]